MVVRNSTHIEPWHIRRGHHIAFEVNDISAMEQRLQHHGVAYDKFELPGTAAVQMFLLDPEGNGIELGVGYEEIEAKLRNEQGKLSAEHETMVTPTQQPASAQ